MSDSEFPGLMPAWSHVHTETAQRFLASAYDSVVGIVDWHDTAMAIAEDRAQEREMLGYERFVALVSDQATDLRRAMIVFAGAGVDATAKQLIRDALPALLETAQLAQDKFVDFAERALDASSPTSARTLAGVLVSQSPRERLIRRYVYHLTGSSLQSAEQLQSVASALGLADHRLRKRLAGLRTAFVARNQIVHELDLQTPTRHGDRERRVRSYQQAVYLSHELLDCGQQLVNAVAGSLGGAPLHE